MTATVPSWPQPQAFLYGYIDTDAPGYRSISVGGTSVVVTGGYYNFPSFVTQLDSQLSASGASASTDSIGRVIIGGTAPVVSSDRIGWMLGMRSEPGDSVGATPMQSISPSPAGIPLLSAQWETIDRAQETSVKVSRVQRGHGYVFGLNELWRVRMTMHVHSYIALREGHCLSGQVIVSQKDPANFSSDSAWSHSNLDGYIQGYVVGLERGRWLDDTKTLYRVNLLISKGASN